MYRWADRPKLTAFSNFYCTEMCFLKSRLHKTEVSRPQYKRSTRPRRFQFISWFSLFPPTPHIQFLIQGISKTCRLGFQHHFLASCMDIWHQIFCFGCVPNNKQQLLHIKTTRVGVTFQLFTRKPNRFPLQSTSFASPSPFVHMHQWGNNTSRTAARISTAALQSLWTNWCHAEKNLQVTGKKLSQPSWRTCVWSAEVPNQTQSNLDSTPCL